MHSISSHDLLEYVKIQCDDKYAGRLTGTSEYQECAEWLAAMFKEWGLTPCTLHPDFSSSMLFSLRSKNTSYPSWRGVGCLEPFAFRSAIPAHRYCLLTS